ncbi:MAG: DUF2892 domain-containing protein [Bdellovibrionales bacterium]|nr:DUF2892 domain-containing protein [Bdellovibrionales bacterium]
MQKNAGKIDRVLRVILGLAVLASAFIGPQTVWGYVGIIPLVTGLIGFCPLYKVIGINTCPLEKKSN